MAAPTGVTLAQDWRGMISTNCCTKGVSSASGISGSVGIGLAMTLTINVP
jgi:hypothetical protein